MLFVTPESFSRNIKPKNLNGQVKPDRVRSGVAYSSGNENHIGRGVRFDAKKEKDGKYFSTTIWKFTMKW